MGNTIHQMKFYLTILLVFGCFSLNKAENGWTQWFDRDDPDGTEDHETLEWIKKENPGKVPCKVPVAIEAKLVDGRDYKKSGNIIRMSPTLGLRCVHGEQKPLSNTCKDFKVRFRCKADSQTFHTQQVSHNTAEYSWTEWFDRDDPSATEDHETLEWIRKENPGKVPCKVPVAIEAKLVDGRDYSESGNIIKMSPTLGLRCVNAEQKPLSNTCKDFKVRFLCKTGPGPVARWTRWLNKDTPSGYLDNETFQSFKNRGIVRNCLPIATEVRLADGKNAGESGNKVHMSAETGFYCVNSENSGRCRDFQVRFLCLPD